MKLSLVQTPLFICPPSALPSPTQHHHSGTLILAPPPTIPCNIKGRQLIVGRSTALSSGGTKVDKQLECQPNSKEQAYLLKNRIGHTTRKFGKRRLPRSSVWIIPNNTTTLWQKAARFLRNVVLESTIAAVVFAIASVCFSACVHKKNVLKNLTRWMVVSLIVKMGSLYSRITSSVPSEARGEGSDWFLQGSYKILVGDSKDEDSSSASTILAKIRQVPGDGSCLFHAIAAGLLQDQTTSDNVDFDETIIHPPMSQVIGHSSNLRTQAVDALENAMKNDSHMIMQNEEAISATLLVNKAAMQYGMTVELYLSNMRQYNVWGGCPEIVALAECLERQIILLEPVNDHNSTAINLKAIARFGAPSPRENPIYILSTNQKFPNDDYAQKDSNHFLAVFPSNHF